jgi:hypothetical protein
MRDLCIAAIDIRARGGPLIIASSPELSLAGFTYRIFIVYILKT